MTDSRSQPVSGNEAVSSTPSVGIDDAPQFHVIAITLRKHPGDRAYHLCESFDAESIERACARHIEVKRPGVRCSVLRDGRTGRRYSVAECQSVIAARAALSAARGEAGT